jgi:hypothetical protein
MEVVKDQSNRRFDSFPPSLGVVPLNFKPVQLCESLKDALKPLHGIYPLAELYDYIALSWVEANFGADIPHGLSKDEAAAIYVYTAEQSDRVCTSLI